MAFLERDETNGRLAGATSVARAWLRAIFYEDWALKLLALLISIGLWWGVTGQRHPVTVRIEGVQLSYRLPPNTEISNDPRREVEVTLSGAELLLQRINTHDLVGFVDLSDYKEGDRIVTLNRDRVKMGLPNGVRIDDIEPSTVTIRLEQRVEADVPVTAKIDGNPADGYEVRDTKITPEHVRVRGPKSRVAALQSVSTEPISVSGLGASFSNQEVAIDITDRKINVVDPLVSVSVEIAEKRIERTFAGVVVAMPDGSRPNPASVSVTVYGTRSALDNLQSSALKVILVEGEDGSLIPRLVSSSGESAEVELRSTTPSRFVSRKAAH